MYVGTLGYAVEMLSGQFPNHYIIYIWYVELVYFSLPWYQIKGCYIQLLNNIREILTLSRLIYFQGAGQIGMTVIYWKSVYADLVRDVRY